MIANINPETGIAYGYISANSLDSDLVQELLYGPKAIDESYADAYRDAFPDNPESDADYAAVQAFNDSYECGESTISGELDGVTYRTSWLGGALNFFILKSPWTTDKARLASPCVPNAAILDTLDGSVTGYNVPDDWRCAGFGIGLG